MFAGARQAGKDLDVNVPELGAQSESDINGQISILENAVAEKPAAVVISPTEFKALGKPIDEAAKKVPIIGIDSSADSKAFTSFLTTDNVQGGRIAADGLAAGDHRQIRQGRRRRRAHHLSAGRRLARRARQGLQGRARGQISRPQARRRQGRGRQGHDRPQHHDRPHHRQPEPARRVRLEPDHGQGAGQAIAENKKADTIKLIGFDSDDKLVGFLKDGTIHALVVQDPYRMGYDGIKTALAASKGEKVEAFVDTGANLVTKANMDGAKAARAAEPEGQVIALRRRLLRRGAHVRGTRRPSPRPTCPAGARRAASRRALAATLARVARRADDERKSTCPSVERRCRMTLASRRSAATTVAPLLVLQKLDKRFGATHALKAVDLAFEEGEIHAIVGENGAGKSTLIKLLTGVHPRTLGRGLLARRAGPAGQSARGDRARHQRRPSGGRAVPAPDGRGQHLPRRRDHARRACSTTRRWCAKAQKLLDDLGFDLPAGAVLSSLTIGQQQLVATARAERRGAKFLIFDEPTAYLTRQEAAALFKLIRRLKANGVTIVYISHRLEEVFELCDRVSVLRDGALVGTRRVERDQRGRPHRPDDQPHDRPDLPQGQGSARRDDSRDRQSSRGPGFHDVFDHACARARSSASTA